MAARAAGERTDGDRLAHFAGLPLKLPASCITHSAAPGTSLDPGLERLSNECPYRGGTARAFDADTCLSSEARAVAACPSDHPHLFPAFCAGLARLDRWRPALHLQCHQLRASTIPQP